MEATKDQAESSLMSNLLAELEDENQKVQPEADTEEEEVLANDEEGEEEEEASDNEPKITAEMAIDAGLPKEFVGKPISELSKSYRNLLADYTNKSKELAELKKAPAKPKEPENDDIPDPIDDPKGYAEYLISQVERKLMPIEEAKKAQEANQVIEQIRSQLPKGVDFSALLNEWGNYNGLTEADYADYINNPKRLLRPVVDYYYAKRYREELARQKKVNNNAEIAKQAKKTTQADLSQLSSYKKTTSENSDDPVKRLLKMLE